MNQQPLSNQEKQNSVSQSNPGNQSQELAQQPASVAIEDVPQVLNIQMNQISQPISPTGDKTTKKKKGPILIAGIVVIFILMIIFFIGALALINGGEDNSSNGENNNTDNGSGGNVINIDNNTPDYNEILGYIELTDDDTIVGYTEIGEEFDLQLDREDWSSLQISPDSRTMSVLSNTSANADLNIFTFADAEWKRLTDYSAVSSGISSYTWASSNEIFFVQGEGIGKWLHRLRLDSNEITKIVQVDGEVISSNLDGLLLFKMDFDDQLRVYDTEGSLVWQPSSVADDLEDGAVISDLTFASGNLPKVVLTTETEQLNYKMLVDETEAVLVESASRSIAVCSINSDDFIFITVESNTNDQNTRDITIKTVDTTVDSDLSEIGVQVEAAQNAVIDKFMCLEDQDIIFEIGSAEGNSWFRIDSEGEVSEIEFLSGEEVVTI